MRRVCLVLVVLAGCSKTDDPWVGLSSTPYSLRSMLNDAEFIGVGALSASDPKNSRTGIRVVRTLKGKAPPMDWTWEVTGLLPTKTVARHLVEGAPVVVFSAGSNILVYVNRFFIFSYGDPAARRWANSGLEDTYNQVFNGTATELAQVCEKVLKGEMRAPLLNPTLPPMDLASLRKLPDWNEDVPDAKLPPPFRKGTPPPVVPLHPEKPESTVAGVNFARFEGSGFSEAETPVETGTSPLPDSHHGSDQRRLGLRFRGFIEVPKDGDYVFISRCEKDATVRLWIGSTEISTAEVVPEYVPLLAGKHAVTLRYLGLGGPGHLELLWSGPDLPKEQIPAKAWSRYP